MAPLKRISAAVFALFASAALASAQGTAAPESPTVVVSGEGVVKAVPDQAWLNIGAESRSKVSKEAQSRNAEAMTAVQQKMTSLGIPKDAIRTLAIDLQMEYDYANGRQTPRGYVARNTIEVRVDDFAKLGADTPPTKCSSSSGSERNSRACPFQMESSETDKQARSHMFRA